MDPLSDALQLLKLRSYVSGGFNAGGRWAISFAKHEGIKFHVVVAGTCWVSLDGENPVKVCSGECFLLPRGLPFTIASDLTVPPVQFQQVVKAQPTGSIHIHNGGGEYLSIGGYFTLLERQADLILGALPPLLHIRRQADSETIRWCAERMLREIGDGQPGDFIVAQQLATIVLVHALRLHLFGLGNKDPGWLFALADKRLHSVIVAIHGSPGERWTIQTLADVAGMSRTAFAVNFKNIVGISPIDYLTRWRMMRAADSLTSSTQSLAEIGLRLGYESEKSFSNAFKRVMKLPPREYARQRKLDEN